MILKCVLVLVQFLRETAHVAAPRSHFLVRVDVQRFSRVLDHISYKCKIKNLLTSRRFPLTEFLGSTKRRLHFVLLVFSVDVQFNFGQIDFDFETLDVEPLLDDRSLDGTLPVDDAEPRNKRLPGGLGKKNKVKDLCQMLFQ